MPDVCNETSLVEVPLGSKIVCPGAGFGATGLGLIVAGAIGTLFRGAIACFP